MPPVGLSHKLPQATTSFDSLLQILAELTQKLFEKVTIMTKQTNKQQPKFQKKKQLKQQ